MLVSGFRDDGRPRFLVNTYAIDYLPYAGIIDLLQSMPDQRKENVLAVGNPEFKNPSTARVSGEDPVPASLPYSGREADRITSMIPHSRLLVGEDASERNFRKYAGSYRVLHLSTHSFLDDRQPFYSRLAFAGDSRDNDGNLYTYEIFNLNIKAELVVLSACETGCGKLSRGEGIVGLSRAFMFAGASSLVVSLWPVGDRGTSRLMSEFYRHLWQGDDKMTALRKAKMSLIDSSEFSDPFYWAPFILIGDPQPLHFRKNSGWQSWLLWLVMGMLAVSVGVGLRVRRR